jgi:hypothetical protein
MTVRDRPDADDPTDAEYLCARERHNESNWNVFWEKQRPSFFFGVLCLVGAVAHGRVAVIAQKLDPWQDFWVVFLFSLSLIWAALATFVGRSHLVQAVSSENVEARLNEWILKFRFVNQKLADSLGYRFAYRITAREGQVVVIGQPAKLDNYLRYRTDVAVIERHRRVLNDLGENGRRRFMIEYTAECAKARVQISARALPLTVKIERTLPITRHLNADDLWAGLEAMLQDVVIAVTHIDLCLERVRGPRDETQSALFAAPSSSAPDAEKWTPATPSGKSESAQLEAEI